MIQAWHTPAAPPRRPRGAVLLVLACCVGGCEAESPAPAAAPQVAVVDLPAHVAEMQRARPDHTDLSQPYLGSAGGSAHLHVMGRGQTTPLHLHRGADEVSVIVSGRARVLQVWGRDGERRSREETYGPGSLIHSPPLTGHEWVNADPGQAVANLVLSLPPFSGNLYVRPDDPRLLRGGEPLRLDPAAALADFAASGEAHRLTPLLAEGRLALLLLAGSYELAPAPPRRVLGYLLEGRLALAGQRVVEAGALLRFDGGAPLELRAEGGSAALLLFDPDRPAPAG